MASLTTYRKRLAEHEEVLRYHGAFQEENGEWNYLALSALPDDGQGGVDWNKYCSEAERDKLIRRHAVLQCKIELKERLPLCIICFEPEYPWKLDEEHVCWRKKCKEDWGKQEVRR